MSNITIFILGSSIFFLYMFFLLRMIWRQHQIQEKSDPQILKIEKTTKSKAS